MSGAPRPPWVIKDLSAILGLDSESISQLLLPEFEAYTNQTKLKSHLQDFLGPSPPAKAFTEKYLALRFPSLQNIPIPKPVFAAPEKPSTSSRPSQNTENGNNDIADSLHRAFGPGGKLYQKNRDADDSNAHTPAFGIRRQGGGGSGTNSGSHTPARHGGAVTIAAPKAQKLGGAGSKGGSRSDTPAGGSSKRIWDVPKSKEVIRLEGIVKDLRGVQAGEGKVVMGDTVACFCLAKNHELSNYTPSCPHCGLILCELHPVHHPCPSCLHPILSPPALARLILRITGDIDSQLALEQSQRDEEERKKQAELAAQAAFPYLAGAKSVPVPFQDQQNTGRKVLTIGGGSGNNKGKGKGKAVLTTTYTVPTPTATPSQEELIPVENIVPRPRSPPIDSNKREKELAKTLNWREKEDRPWGDMKAEKKGGKALVYVPLPVIVPVHEDHMGRRRAKKKTKGLGADGRAVVGAAVDTAA